MLRNGRLGERPVRESVRFFMVPGMGHGPGTGGAENFDFDALSLIEQWKERGQAPDTLTMALFRDGTNVGTRLVCQYPRIASALPVRLASARHSTAR